MRKLLLFLVLIIATLSLALLEPESKPNYLVSEASYVAEVLENLGDEVPNKVDQFVNGVSAKSGKELVLYGRTVKPFGGGKTKKQSKHFVCTSCHNIEREDPDLTVSDPQARLDYVQKNGLPFLQGTTLYGAVNRTSFYNGDYEKKYGDLVKPARNSIREAIQLCAVECAQGRRLKEWELESILAYLWTIGLKMGDLNLEESIYDDLKEKIEDGQPNKDLIQKIKSAYLEASPATFVEPPKDRKSGYGLTGNPQNGKLIYELSCLHCHEKGRYAFFKLDGSKYSLNYLDKHFPKYTRYSVYQVARYGTSPMNWKRTYMPNYTLEKMSHQQMEDLRAYVQQQTE